MDLVLGVEDPDDIAAAVRQRRVHGLRLVLLLVRVDDDADARVALGGAVGHRRGLGVVVPHDHDDLEVGVRGLQQPLDGVVEHGLFVLAGSSNENDTCSSPSGLLNRVEASTSGVRHACICHHRVKAAIQNKASETTAMKTDVSTTDPPRSPYPLARR